MNRFRDSPATGTKGERVILREGALPLQAGRDRRLEELGQRPQLRPGPCVVDALPGVDDRPPGLHQHPRDLADAFRVGPRANSRRRLIGERGRQLFIEDVFWDLDEDRSRSAVLDLGERAPQRIWHRRGHGHLFGGLGDVLKVEVGAEVGWNRGHVRG